MMLLLLCLRDAERELAVVEQEHAEAMKTMQQAHAEVVAAHVAKVRTTSNNVQSFLPFASARHQLNSHPVGIVWPVGREAGAGCRHREKHGFSAESVDDT